MMTFSLSLPFFFRVAKIQKLLEQRYFSLLNPVLFKRVFKVNLKDSVNISTDVAMFLTRLLPVPSLIVHLSTIPCHAKKNHS